MSIHRVDPGSVGVLIIDAQPAFFDSAFPDGGAAMESVVVRLEHLLMLADWLDLPVITTFETPIARNGELHDRLEEVFPANGGRFIKSHFGCVSEPEIADALAAAGVGQWLVAGAETDVCVLQSALGLLEAGYVVFLLEDCVFTSEPNPGPALHRLYSVGVTPTTLKTAAYELVQCADRIPWSPDFWAADYRPAKPFPADFIVPEAWPAWERSV